MAGVIHWKEIPMTTANDATTSTYQCRGKLWKYPGESGNWYFVTLPVSVAQEIRTVDAGPQRRGFDSLKVIASIGASTWETSIFPSASHNSYLLPVKAAVRKAEGLRENAEVKLRLLVRRRG
jgi:hypothetical protein